jgi:hypothetical protein
MVIPYPETVTVVRVTTDNFGDTTTGTTFDVPGCIIYPRVAKAATNVNRGGNETTVAEDIVTFGLSVLMPPGTDVLATDRVVARGTTYEVDGNPTNWSSPLSNFQPGCEVLLKRVTG